MLAHITNQCRNHFDKDDEPFFSRVTVPSCIVPVLQIVQFILPDFRFKFIWPNICIRFINSDQNTSSGFSFFCNQKRQRTVINKSKKKKTWIGSVIAIFPDDLTILYNNLHILKRNFSSEHLRNDIVTEKSSWQITVQPFYKINEKTEGFQNYRSTVNLWENDTEWKRKWI